MSTEETTENENEPLWRTIFQDGHPDLLKQHWLHRKLPSPPRCRLCLVPFEGLGGWWMRKRGKARSDRNEHYCSACDGFLAAFPGGAEVEMTLLFADIRQSSQMAEDLGSAQFAAKVNAFYAQVGKILAASDGFVVELRGDCIAGAYPPGFSGQDHAAKAVRAAVEIVKQSGSDGAAFGVGVHAGPVFIGTVDTAAGRLNEVSVFGETVNMAAKLSDVAPAGQALVSTEAATLAGMSGDLSPATEISTRESEVLPITAHPVGR